MPDSDDTPVDELHILMPILLRGILALVWAGRMDWFLGVTWGSTMTLISQRSCPMVFSV